MLITFIGALLKILDASNTPCILKIPIIAMIILWSIRVGSKLSTSLKVFPMPEFRGHKKEKKVIDRLRLRVKYTIKTGITSRMVGAFIYARSKRVEGMRIW